MTLSTRYYGTQTLLSETLALRAGPLALVYDGGDLRYVKLGEVEIVRRIYVAVRDQNWNTIAAELHDVEIDISERAFSISYAAVHRQDNIDFRWQGSITGSEEGEIRFQMAGRAHSNFERNRIGFCILHPMACAGAPCQIEHVDDSVEESTFPQFIAPQLNIDGEIQPVHPFSNLRSMIYPVVPGVTAKIALAGEIFEMEDQRNWTDASFKTYGTPLAQPFPVAITEGTEIEQSVTLTLEGASVELDRDKAESDKITVAVARTEGRSLPALGLGMASHGRALTPKEIEQIRQLNLSHIRVDLNLADASIDTQLKQASEEADALAVDLEVALFLGQEPERELAQLAELCRHSTPSVARWLVFARAQPVTPAGLVSLARRHLEKSSPNALFGIGSNAYFTDINRERPDLDGADILAYSINPQVHAFDNASLVETLAAQAVTVESARQFAEGREIVVSPVTLLPRFNPNATGPEPPPAPDTLPTQVDVRQMSLFGAAWTAGSLKYLGLSGVHSVTYYETTGWRGVMETEQGSPLPNQFISASGQVFPLYHILADAGEFAGGEVLDVQASHSLQVDALALRKETKLAVVVANFGSQTQRVTVSGLGAQIQMRALDDTTFDQAGQDPVAYRAIHSTPFARDAATIELDVLPYGVVRIDSTL